MVTVIRISPLRFSSAREVLGGAMTHMPDVITTTLGERITILTFQDIIRWATAPDTFLELRIHMDGSAAAVIARRQVACVITI